MKKTILLIFSVFTFLVLSANDTVADSLLNLLERSKPDSKAEILYHLAEHFLGQDNQKSLEYAQRALIYADPSRKELNINVWNTIATAYEYDGNYDQALEYYYKNLERIGDEGFVIQKAYIYYSLGLVYDSLSEYDKALQNYLEAERLYREEHEMGMQANVLNNIGILYETLTGFDTALEYYFESLKIYQESGDKIGTAHTYNNIGNIYQTMRNFSKSQEYYDRSMDIYKELGDKSGISSILNNLGILFDEKKEYDKALEYYNSSLELAREIEEESGIATAQNNIGIIYQIKGQYPEAVDFYLNSLEISRKINDQWGIANTLSNLGELYIVWGQSEKGIDYLEQGFQIASTYNYRDLVMECYNIYSKYFISKNNYEEAYRQMTRYYQLKDSLYLDSSRRIAEIQTIYETDKKEKEIELLILAKRHQRSVKFFFIFSTAFFLIIAAWLYRLYIQKNREMKKRRRLEKKIIGLASVVNQANESIIITDTKGVILYLNPCYEKKTGKTLEELQDRRADFWDKTKQGSDLTVWETVIKDQEWFGTLESEDCEGKNCYETVAVFPIKDEDGDIINYAAVKHDITAIINKENELMLSEEKFRRMAENISDGLAIVEKGEVVFVNDRLAEITGYSKEELKHISGIALAAPFEKQRVKDFSELSKKYPDQLSYFEFWIKRKDGELRYIHNGYSLYKKDGEIVNRYMVVSDITDRKKYEQKIERALKEKEVLLQEINHRVKNNMQIISSLLKLQAGYLEDEKLLKLFRNSQNRVKSMSLIHEKLYKSEDLTRITFQDYVESLTRHLYTTYGVSEERINLLINAFDIKLSIDKAIPCGLIVNELVSNSLKYAFPSNQKGLIRIEMVKKDEGYILTVQDDGEGLSEDFDLYTSNTLGMQLIRSLTEQLHGKISRTDAPGLGFRIVFK